METKKTNGLNLAIGGLVLFLAVRGCGGCISDITDITGFSDKYEPSEVVACKSAHRDHLPEITIRKWDGRTNRYYTYVPDEKENYHLLTNEYIFKQVNKLQEPSINEQWRDAKFKK